MLRRTRQCRPLPDRGPLRVLFVLTSMPVGGAETLLVNLVRRFDPNAFLPEICCLKELGPLGQVAAKEYPTHCGLLRSKWDVRVLSRLRSVIRERRIDSVVTVGAGDKMFWGRLAAWLEGTPVILSALHSTGWPDTIGRLNHLLTPLTDAFIAVAERHGEYLVDVEGFPAAKVHVIPNGIDVQHFRPRPECREAIRSRLGLAETTPVCTIVAALRPEKNHELFLQSAARVREDLPDAHFLIVGDGPQRAHLEAFADKARLRNNVHFLGSRDDVAELLAASDVFSLTSHMEANPVSILESLATEVPVVASRVGSIEASVREGETGYLVEPGDATRLAEHWLQLLRNPVQRQAMGRAGRQLVVSDASLERMVEGYQQLIRSTYGQKYPLQDRGTPRRAGVSGSEVGG